MPKIWTIPALDIDLKRGDSFVFPLVFTEKNETTGIVSDMDLTGIVLYFTIKKSLSEDDPGVFQQTVTVHDTANTSHFSITPAESKLFPVNVPLYYDIQLEDPLWDVYTYLEWVIRCTEDSTLAPL